MGTGDEGLLLPGLGRDSFLEGAGNRWSDQDGLSGLLGAGKVQEEGGGPARADTMLVGLQARFPHPRRGSGPSPTQPAPGRHGCPGSGEWGHEQVQRGQTLRVDRPGLLRSPGSVEIVGVRPSVHVHTGQRKSWPPPPAEATRRRGRGARGWGSAQLEEGSQPRLRSQGHLPAVRNGTRTARPKGSKAPSSPLASPVMSSKSLIFSGPQFSCLGSGRVTPTSQVRGVQ